MINGINDLEGYITPLSIFHQQDEIIRELNKAQDDYVYKAVLKTGVSVDYDELIRALRYDREQYQKGYHAGYSASLNEVKDILLSAQAEIKSLLDRIEGGVEDDA